MEKGLNINPDLAGVTLRGADLHKVDLCEALLVGANLSEANLAGVNLINVLNLTKEQVNSANIDESTQLPDYLTTDAKPEDK